MASVRTCLSLTSAVRHSGQPLSPAWDQASGILVLIQQNERVKAQPHKHRPHSASVNIWPHPAGGSPGTSKPETL